MSLPRSLIVLLVTTSVAAVAENGRPRAMDTDLAPGMEAAAAKLLEARGKMR